MLRGAPPEMKQAASEAAGALYSVTALALFCAGASAPSKDALLPVVDLRAAVAVTKVIAAFSVLELTWPNPDLPGRLGSAQKAAAETGPVAATMMALGRGLLAR